MRIFKSAESGLTVSHPALKAAAGNNEFVLSFRGDTFETENDALADALNALEVAGVVEVTPEAPVKPEPAKEAPVGPKRKRNQ